MSAPEQWERERTASGAPTHVSLAELCALAPGEELTRAGVTYGRFPDRAPYSRTAADVQREPDLDCGNCNGNGCMDCACRVLHDDCRRDCPACCPPPPVACAVDTYVSAGYDDEYGFFFTAECVGGKGGACGWEVDLSDSEHQVSVEGWPVLNRVHREHSEAVAVGLAGGQA